MAHAKPPRRRLYTIRAMLALLVTACVLPTLLISAALAYFVLQQEYAGKIQDRQATARALMQAVDRRLAGAQGTLVALATSPHLANGDLAGFRTQLEQAQPFWPNNNVVLSDAGGQQLINTLRPVGSGLPRHGNPDQLRRVFATGKPVISDLYLGGVLGRPVISVDVPVLRNGRVAYDLSMGFLPEHLVEILRQQRIPEDWVAAIFDSRGLIVARTRAHEAYVGKPGAPSLVRQMSGMPEGTVQATTLEGQPVTSSFCRSTVSSWSVAIGAPRFSWHSEWPTMLSTLGAAVVLPMVVSLALARGVADRIAAAVNGLVAPANALGAGDPVGAPRLSLKEADDVAQALIRAERVLRVRTVERDLAEQAETDLLATQQQLEASASFQRRLFDEAPNAILVVRRSGDIVRANAEAERMFGYPRDRLQSMPVEALVPAESRVRHAEQREGYALQPERRPMGGGRHLRACRADGAMFDVDIMLSPLDSPSGMLTIATVLDVTSLHRQQEKIESALREKETLLKEIYHRVKNNLQVIASMISLQERAAGDGATSVALKEAADRVRAMALVHEKLYQSDDLSSIALDTYIAELCTQLGNGAAAAERGISLETQVEAIQIGLEQAVPLGLVLHELISNCLKHAFPDGRRGRIVVRLEAPPDAPMRLSVADDGVGMPAGVAPGSARSLGMRLVWALARQLDAELTLASHQGTVATLILGRNGRKPV